ncbi:MAG: hypothetical protein AB7I36_16880 [Rhodospirillaceae bacterium]
MAMHDRHFVERGAAAGILLLAVVLAWMIADRPDVPPPPQAAAEPPPTPEPAPSETPSPAQIAAALSVELVEIEEPPPKIAAAPAPPVRPPAVQVAAPVPQPVTPPHAVPEPPPESLPVKEVLPLQPTPPAVSVEAAPAVLHPEPAPVQAREVVPLTPTPPRVRPEAPVVQHSAPREEKSEPEVTPLRPTPPAPKPEPEVIRVQAPVPAPAVIRPAPAKAPSQQPSPAVNVAAVMGEGRAFLKILEQGAGPGIEIRWPSDPAQRARLYGALVQCLGMRTGLLDGDGRLYLAEGQKGQPSTLDGERYSGFVRRPEGAIAREEEREIGRVRSYHQVRATASAARIFPRRVDAYLIGGLRGLVGDAYLKTKSIRATYRMRNGAPIVDSIIADGRRIDGSVDLSDVANSCSG